MRCNAVLCDVTYVLECNVDIVQKEERLVCVFVVNKNYKWIKTKANKKEDFA